MRILLLHDYGTLNGGAEHMTVMLRERLREQGHAAELLTSTARPLPLPIHADHTCFGTTGEPRRLTQVYNPDAARTLRRTLRRFQPDVVHVRMFMTQLSPSILPLLREVPSILHVVNYNLICPLNTKTLPDGSPCHYRQGVACHRAGCMPWLGVGRVEAQQALWRRGRGAFDRVVANSHWVKRRLEADGERVDRVIWNGAAAVEPRPPLSEPPTVVYVGRLYQKKGVDVLVRAMGPLVEALPEARLLIIGEGPERQSLESLAGELHLENNVQFRGHLPQAEMTAASNAAWVQVVPSQWEEPFGIVTAEAMMRATAVVVSDHGGPAELVENGVTGYRFPPGDHAALADRLLTLLRDRDAAERIGTQARGWAMAHLTETHYVDKVLALYRELRPETDRADQPPVRH